MQNHDTIVKPFILFYFFLILAQLALANKLVPRALLAEYFLEKLNRNLLKTYTNNFFKKK